MHTFCKEERLKGKLTFQNIFSKGKSAKAYPFKFNYIKVESNHQRYPIRVGIAIPKKQIKKAVNRNIIRRRIKEVYRLNKHEYYKILENKNLKIQLIILYLGKEIISYNDINKTLPKSLFNLISDICEKNTG